MYSYTKNVRIRSINYVVSLPVSDQILSAGDSGKIFLLPDIPGAGGVDRTITLPALAPGLHYIFLNSGLAAVHDWIITGGAGILASTTVRAGVAVLSAGSGTATSIRVVGGTSVIGDCVELYSVGTRWSVRASSGAGAGITIVSICV